MMAIANENLVRIFFDVLFLIIFKTLNTEKTINLKKNRSNKDASKGRVKISMVRGQVMFYILTAIEILSFLSRFHSISAIRKKVQWTDHAPTDGRTDRPSYRDA